MQASELLQRIQSNRAPVIIDPRSEIEFKRGHIPGAVNAPVRKILLNRANLPPDRNLEMVIACMHGQRAVAESGFWRTTVIAIWRFSKGIWRVGKRPACLWKSSFVTGRNMAAAGIDVGSQSTKVVIMEGDRILAGAASARACLSRP